MVDCGGGEAFFRVRRVVDTAADCCAPEDSLDELVLAKGFGEVVLVSLAWSKGVGVGATHVHLRRDTFLTVTNHGVGSERNDGGRRDAVPALPFTDLGCSLEATL